MPGPVSTWIDFQDKSAYFGRLKDKLHVSGIPRWVGGLQITVNNHSSGLTPRRAMASSSILTASSPTPSGHAKLFVHVTRMPHFSPSCTIGNENVKPEMNAQKYKGKVPVLDPALLAWVRVWSEALRNLGSGSWLAQANDIAAHYAATAQARTSGPTVLHADMPPPSSAMVRWAWWDWELSG